MKKLLIFISLFTVANTFGQMSIFDTDFDQATPLDCNAQAPLATNFIDVAGDYLPNMDEVITFCPDLTQGTKVTVTFATNIGFEFNIHQSD